MTRLLAPDKEVLLIQPMVALAVGDTEAVVLQQLEYWLEIAEKSPSKYKETHFFEGKWWVYNTYEEWRTASFWWLSVRTIKRVFVRLKERGVIECRRHENRNKGFWTTINYTVLHDLINQASENIPGRARLSLPPEDRSCQVVTTSVTDCHDPEQYRDYTETPKETKDSSAQKSAETAPTENPVCADFEESGAESAARPSTPSAVPPPSPRPRAQKPRRDNTRLTALKNAIAAVFGWDWKSMTKTESGKVQAAATQLYDADVGIELIPRLFAQCQADFPQFGPNALCSVVSKVRASAAQRRARVDIVSQPEAPIPVQETSPEERAELIAWAREQLRGGDGQRA